MLTKMHNRVRLVEHFARSCMARSRLLLLDAVLPHVPTPIGAVGYRVWRLGTRSYQLAQRLVLADSLKPPALPLVIPSGPPTEPLIFPVTPDPLVSIIVPVHNKWEYTYRCLQAVLCHTSGFAYEVILADDASTDATARAPKLLANVVVIRDGVQRGFLDNCNAAATHAKGRYLVFLNNDTAVQPHWLNHLLRTAEADPTVAIVGPKLVYADGTLQEAGGIIFADGSASNYGRGADATASEFNYKKEVDYVSGACLLVRRSVWDAAGGFDRRYAPGYFEDPDLAFTARSLGFKVVYQPQAVVIHFEGVSHGRDVTTGIKRYQVLNAGKFHEKWRTTLTSEQQVPDDLFWARDRSRSMTTVLVIDENVPQYDRDAGSRFMWGYLSLFADVGCHVILVPATFEPDEPYTSQLQQLGIEVLYGSRYRRTIRNWIREHRKYLDVIYLHKPSVASEYMDAARMTTNAAILYCPADLHSLRERRRFDVTAAQEARQLAAFWEASEGELFRKADMIHVVSEYEAEILRERLPEKPVHTVPVFIFDEEPPADVPPFEHRRDMMFVGGFLHQPNRDAAEWFIREVMPFVREGLPGVRLHLVGSSPEVVSHLAAEDIIVAGRVSERALRLLYGRIRLVVCPLRFGAGAKGKVVESLFFRVPAVVTPVAAEGLPGVEEYVVVPTSESDLAGRIIEVYTSRELWNQLSRRSSEYVSARFSREAAARAIASDLETLSVRRNAL
jgi:GT2 family glycosyltransferase/glycosyltransferase involved in cell wall biosynthesis